MYSLHKMKVLYMHFRAKTSAVHRRHNSYSPSEDRLSGWLAGEMAPHTHRQLLWYKEEERHMLWSLSQLIEVLAITQDASSVCHCLATSTQQSPLDQAVVRTASSLHSGSCLVTQTNRLPKEFFDIPTCVHPHFFGAGGKSCYKFG